jgi:serine/threonine protein kinase
LFCFAFESHLILLGRGAFATVYLGLLHNYNQVAIKKLKFPEDNEFEKAVEEYFKEASIMIELRHNNVVSLLGIIE